MKRLGLIQSRGIGDIIIALPIAQHYLATGYEVFWPIDAGFVPFVSQVEPRVKFLPVRNDAPGFMYDEPKRLLEAQGCSEVICLYSYLSSQPAIGESRLSQSLKFDEYKYAISKVPFRKKWELVLRRNPERERALQTRLNLRSPYAVVHREGSNRSFDQVLPPQLFGGLKVVEIKPITDNPFDWIGVLRNATLLVLLDSVFANLVEQLNFPNEKIFLLRSEVRFTPVMRNGWRFV
jgi:hypothetical protein